MSADASEDETREAALSDEKVRAWTDGKQIIKTVVVPGRLVNVVVR
jgi:leucyl-tRNA synthetase